MSGYGAKIILDSVNPVCGTRLTTMEVTFPRMVLAEFNTHRVFSRNSASSRAIPVKKMLDRVKNEPAVPKFWGKNVAGMQAPEELTGVELMQSQQLWLRARDQAVIVAEQMMAVGLHKQIANRILEPFVTTTVIVSATQWENFFKLRCHKDAQPEIRFAAELMRAAYRSSNPQIVDVGAWHIPMLRDEDTYLSTADQLKVATGRLARVSYLTHDGVRDVEADIELHDRLSASGHWSPFEHCAVASIGSYAAGNFVQGWDQYRKRFLGETGQ